MSGDKVFVVLLIDVVAAVATVALAAKLRGPIVGGIIGLVLELIRIGIAQALVGSVYRAGPVELFMLNLRVYNIPILIGLGLMAGSAASQTTPQVDASDSYSGETQTFKVHLAKSLGETDVESVLGALKAVGGKVTPLGGVEYRVEINDRQLVDLSNALWSHKEAGKLSFDSE